MLIADRYWRNSLQAVEDARRAPTPALQAEFLRMAMAWAELARTRRSELTALADAA